MRVGDKVERIFNTVDKNSPDFKGEVANHNHHDQYFKAGQRYTISKLSGQDFLSVEEVPNRDFNRRNFRVVRETIKVGDKVERIYGQSVGGLTVGDDHFVRGTQYTVKKIFGHQTLEVEEYPEVIYDLDRFKRVTTKMTRFEQRRLDLEEFLDPLLPAQASVTTITSTFSPTNALNEMLRLQEEAESRRIVGRTPQELMQELFDRMDADAVRLARGRAPPAPPEPQKKSAPVDPKRYGMGPRKVK